MPVFLHQSDPEFFREKASADYVVKKLTKKYSKTGAFAKTTRDDAKLNLFIGLLDQLESELTKFQTYYTEYDTGAFEDAPSTRRKKRSSKLKDIEEVKGDIGLGSIVGLIKRVSRILDSYPTFNSLNPRDIATLTKSYQDLMVFISGFQDLTESSDDYKKRLADAKAELEDWDATHAEDEDTFEARSEREQLVQFVRNAKLPPPLRIQGVANAFYADLYNFLVAFRTKLNIYETDPENKTPSFGAKRPVVAGDAGDDDGDDGDDGENRGFDALVQEGASEWGLSSRRSNWSERSVWDVPRSSASFPDVPRGRPVYRPSGESVASDVTDNTEEAVAKYLRRPDVRQRLETRRGAPFPEPIRVAPHGAFLEPYFIEDIYEPEIPKIPRRGRIPNVYSADVVLDSRVGKKAGVRTRSQGDFKDYMGDLRRPIDLAPTWGGVSRDSVASSLTPELDEVFTQEGAFLGRNPTKSSYLKDKTTGKLFKVKGRRVA